MLIDIHVHLYTDSLAEKVRKHLSEHYGIPVIYQGTKQEYQAIMKNEKVEAAVFCTAATVPAQVAPANDWAVANNKGNLIGFGTMHPDYDRIDEEIKKLKAAGIKGIKLHPDFQQFYLDDEKALSMYEKLAKDFIFIFHIGDDQDQDKINYTSPHRMARALDLIPNMRVIVAHMGGYKMWDQALDCLVGRNIYLDTASTYDFLPADQFRNIIKEHGYQKILLGSDYPYSSPGREANLLKNLNLKDYEYQAIIRDNAKKLLAGLGL